MHRIILDTDYSIGYPGSDVDDGFALALAHAEKNIDLDCVTTVFGNAPVAPCTELAKGAVESLGGQQPVVEGAAGPLLFGESSTSCDSGIDTRAGSHHAAIEIRDRVLAQPGEITLVAIGPLTNVALALLLDPAVARDTRELIVMGGAFTVTTGTGGTWPGEFNIWNDPVSAQIVLNSGVSQRWIGLDVTTKVTLTRAELASLSQGSEFMRQAADAAVKWVDFLSEEHPGQYGIDEVEVHDATALAALTRPELFTWADAHVRIGTENNATRGITVVDFLRAKKNSGPGNCRVATNVNAPALKQYLLDHLSSISEPSASPRRITTPEG